ncbi:Nucleotide-binding alpha-beta plait domain [Phytophthora cactorum]|nr:Nucleotide-binding alpha-beta plait domain [Phytophthora cactorum]
MSDRGSPSPRRSRSRSPSFRADENEDKKSPRVSDNEERETSRRSRSRSPAPKAPAAPADVVNPGNNLYVANLATRELFSKFGRVDKCEVIVDPSRRSRGGFTVTFDTERRMLMLLLNGRGFGFVTFEDVRDAEDAVKELNKGGRLEWNTPNGSVGMRRPPDSTLDRDSLAQNTAAVVSASAGIAVGTEDGGVAAETAAGTRVANDDRDRGRNDDRGRGSWPRGYDRDSYDDRRRR